MRNFVHQYCGIIVSLLATGIIALIGFPTGIFWDNMLFVSKMSAPLMEHGAFAWGQIPTLCDPGHPPFAATYLTLVWQLFGRSLTVSHIALYPIIFLFCFELWQITMLLFKRPLPALAAFGLVLADATVFCQLMLVGTEVFVLCFAMIAIHGILSGNPIRKSIGLMLLGIASLRGMMLCLGLFLWDKDRFKHIAAYVAGAIPAVVFLVWRIICIGWIISNPLQPWGSAWDFTSFTDFMLNFLRNGVVLTWRIADFGRIVPILCIAVIAWIYRKQMRQDERSRTLLRFCIYSCSIVAITSLIIRNPMGHSYFLLIYIGFGLLLVSLLSYLQKPQWIYAIALCALLAGNTIIYPEKISQGWPASLASMPYWSLRNEVSTELESCSIAPENVYTFFPWGDCADDVDLSGDKRSYAHTIKEAEYLIASNICNLDDETLDALPHYELISSHRKGGVWVNLYRITP